MPAPGRVVVQSGDLCEALARHGLLPFTRERIWTRMPEITVESYSGYKVNQRPVRFTLGKQTLEVVSVEDQWYSPDCVYFRVRADDGNVYVLRHDEETDRWSLHAFRCESR